jgi:hydroxyacid-oxoacid transhydrogenase
MTTSMLPVGLGMPVPGPLLPLFAIPTTAGTGSETTGMIIFDDTRTRCKTGIGHRRLKPTLGILDPDNTATLPPEVTVERSGFLQGTFQGFFSAQF